MRKYLTNYCKLIWDEGNFHQQSFSNHIEFQFKDLPTYSTSNLFLDNPEYSTALLTLHHVLFPDTINDGLNISDIFTNLSEKITRELFPLVFHQRDINFALSLTFQEIFASFLFSEISFVNLKSLVLEHLCLIVDEASLPNVCIHHPCLFPSYFCSGTESSIFSRSEITSSICSSWSYFRTQ